MAALRVIPLGGLGEIGMNCLALEQRGEVMLVDCGVTFDDRGLGVDVVHPDFGPLEPYRDRIAGVVITHGHEDHIGALPYLLKRFDVPVYGPPYALGLVRERLGEHEVLGHARLHEIRPREAFRVGSFEVEPMRVTHSIADALALAITTDAGMVVHSGDFKFDDAPPDGEEFDVERFRALGDRGVSLLFSDSTNVDSDGSAGSEAAVGDALEPLVLATEGAVVVAMFASNVHRMRLLGDLARDTKRKLVLLGRSVSTHARVAHATGYLEWPGDLVFPSERARELPRNQIMAIATGTQGEASAALAKLARGEHPALDVGAGDAVILSSRIIPGHEPEVYGIMGALIRRGVRLHTRVSDRGIHVSGHAHRGEQTRMIELVRPRAFIPVHGTLHHLTRHAELARSLGVAEVLVIENGDVARLDETGLAKEARVVSGRVHTYAGRAIPSSVLRERVGLAEGGICLVVVSVDEAGRVVGAPSIATRGLIDELVDAHLLADVKRDMRIALAELKPEDALNDSVLAETARLAVRRGFARALGHKPMTVVTVLRVGVAAS